MDEVRRRECHVKQRSAPVVDIAFHPVCRRATPRQRLPKAWADTSLRLAKKLLEAIFRETHQTIDLILAPLEILNTKGIDRHHSNVQVQAPFERLKTCTRHESER